jgi:copper(I)-binding protein
VNRALRAAALGLALLSATALTACSAGQINQTSSQERDKSGPQGEIGDILLREVQLAYPNGGTYAPGAEAELNAAIVNTGAAPDTLVSITSPAFTQYRITGSPTGTASATPTNNTGTGNGLGAAPTAGRTTVTIPADTSVVLGQTGPTVTLVGLNETLTPAQTVPLTFTFQTAGTVTIQALVGTPTSAVPRSDTFNFEVPTEATKPGDQAG